MTVFQGKLLLLLTLNLATAAQAQGNFGIGEPFPDNIYPIEFTSAEVTCVAFDSTGVKIPEKILFMRKDQFAVYQTLTPNGNIYFTNVTDIIVMGEGREALHVTRLSVTLHIRNVTTADDSQYGALGRYECHAFAVNDSLERKHGFSVSVIRKSEIPQVSVSKARVLQYGEDFKITCNLTEGQSVVTLLKRVSWFKDGTLLQSVRHPDPTEPRDSLGPLDLKSVGVRDGGNYTCLLEVLLRNVKEHNVSDSTKVEIAPWFDNHTRVRKFNRNKGDSVSFVCSAKGYPLEVTWKVEKIKDDAVYASACINETDGKYLFQRKGLYDPYILTVLNLQNGDDGRYYCCISSKCSSGSSSEDQCEVFSVEVAGGSAASLLYKDYPLVMLIFSTFIWISFSN